MRGSVVTARALETYRFFDELESVEDIKLDCSDGESFFPLISMSRDVKV